MKENILVINTGPILALVAATNELDILLHPQNLWVTTGSGSFPSV